MSGFIKGEDRFQATLFPERLETNDEETSRDSHDFYLGKVVSRLLDQVKAASDRRWHLLELDGKLTGRQQD